MTRRSSLPDDRDAERGDIVLGWLSRLTVTLAVIGLIGFDGISLAAGKVQVEDHATSAARAAQTSWQDSHNVQTAYDAALKELADDSAAQDDVDTSSFSVAPDGTVTLTVIHPVTTLLLRRVSATRSWTVLRATASAAPVR